MGPRVEHGARHGSGVEFALVSKSRRVSSAVKRPVRSILVQDRREALLPVVQVV